MTGRRALRATGRLRFGCRAGLALIATTAAVLVLGFSAIASTAAGIATRAMTAAGVDGAGGRTVAGATLVEHARPVDSASPSGTSSGTPTSSLLPFHGNELLNESAAWRALDGMQAAAVLVRPVYGYDSAAHVRARPHAERAPIALLERNPVGSRPPPVDVRLALRDGLAAGDAVPLFSQRTASAAFRHGPFEGKTIGDVVRMLRSGEASAADLPVDVIVRNGETLGLNTRSMLALRRAGVPVSDWVMNDVTGNAAMERLLSERLARNELDAGTDVLRITGAGPSASSLR